MLHRQWLTLGRSVGIRWTGLKVWLLKLGVGVVHARPCQRTRPPPCPGKGERFHRALKAEVFAMRRFRTLPEVQRAFGAWRPVYNLEQPHQGLDMQVPADRFRPSARPMPARVPNVEYDSGEIVREGLIDKTLHLLEGTLLESSPGLRPRTPCHPAAGS